MKLRPGIEFDETAGFQFDEPNHNKHFLEFSPVGRVVPVLKHNGLTLWESLAIMEYLAETFPEASLWPEDASKRAARSRVICNEMHAGFGALRSRNVL